MKRITSIILIAGAVALAAVPILITTGCATSAPTESQCARYRAVYEAYRASLEVRKPSKEEVLAATVAAAYLSAECGWTELKARSEVGAGPTVIRDEHGVPYLLSP